MEKTEGIVIPMRIRITPETINEFYKDIADASLKALSLDQYRDSLNFYSDCKSCKHKNHCSAIVTISEDGNDDSIDIIKGLSRLCYETNLSVNDPILGMFSNTFTAILMMMHQGMEKLYLKNNEDDTCNRCTCISRNETGTYLMASDAPFSDIKDRCEETIN